MTETKFSHNEARGYYRFYDRRAILQVSLAKIDDYVTFEVVYIGLKDTKSVDRRKLFCASTLEWSAKLM